MSIERPRKVTGPELEERFSRWLSGRSRPLRGMLDHRWSPGGPRLLVLTLLAAVLVGLLAVTEYTSAEHDRATTEHEQQVAETEEKIDRARGQRREAADERAAGERLIRWRIRAERDAKTVAARQNEFPGLLRARLQEMSSRSRPQEAPMKAVADQRRELGRLWDQESYVADPEQAYAWTVGGTYEGVDLEAGSIDPRFPWYVPEETYTGMPPAGKESKKAKAARLKQARKARRATCRWTVDSVVPRVQGRSVVDVTWACRNPSGKVSAWASAVHDPRERRFDDLALSLARPESDQDEASTVGASDAGDRS